MPGHARAEPLPGAAAASDAVLGRYALTGTADEVPREARELRELRICANAAFPRTGSYAFVQLRRSATGWATTSHSTCTSGLAEPLPGAAAASDAVLGRYALTGTADEVPREA